MIEPAVDGCDTSSEAGSIYMLRGQRKKRQAYFYICQASLRWYGRGPATYAYDTVAPSTCVTGQVFFDTDATPGQNWLGCTATNTWTLLGSAARSLRSREQPLQPVA